MGGVAGSGCGRGASEPFLRPFLEAPALLPAHLGPVGAGVPQLHTFSTYERAQEALGGGVDSA